MRRGAELRLLAEPAQPLHNGVPKIPAPPAMKIEYQHLDMSAKPAAKQCIISNISRASAELTPWKALRKANIYCTTNSFVAVTSNPNNHVTPTSTPSDIAARTVRELPPHW